MTDEEKARELFKTEIGNLDVPDFDREFEILTAIEAMAEWKEQQFKEYLEKVLTFERLRYECSDVDSENYDLGRCDMVEGIINELFPEQEQDNSNNDE